MGMAHPRSCSWLFEKEGGSERSVQLYKHDKFILSYGAWAWSSLGDNITRTGMWGPSLFTRQKADGRLYPHPP